MRFMLGISFGFFFVGCDPRNCRYKREGRLEENVITNELSYYLPDSVLDSRSAATPNGFVRCKTQLGGAFAIL
uniref:Lipoprotein n=1 Tax=Rhizophora mucronata TaxID=61149 RepID=A0A2P2PI85_RHIMU